MRERAKRSLGFPPYNGDSTVSGNNSIKDKITKKNIKIYDGLLKKIGSYLFDS